MIVPFLCFCILAVILAAVLLILYARRNYGVLEALNIPIVKPHFFLGSLPDLHLKVQHLEDIERFKKFGPIYGLYEGANPQIHICDPDIIRLIWSKDYEYFKERGAVELGHNIPNQIVDYLPYDAWKYVRTVWTQAFSNGRVKQMRSEIHRLSKEHAQDFKMECDGKTMKYEIRKKLCVILVDILNNCIFGVQMQNRKDPDNSDIKLMRSLLCENMSYKSTYNLSLVFPFLKRFLLPYKSNDSEIYQKQINYIFEARRKSGVKNGNFADGLIEMQSKLGTLKLENLKITDDTVTAQALEILFTFMDTTGSVLTFLVYYLTQYPEVQDTLLDEIDSFISENGGGDGEEEFDKIQELPYLNACLTEAMRLSTPFLRPERICTKDWEYKGLRIPKGMTIMIPLFAAHRNSNYFPDPETFDPTRFLPENKGKIHPYAFSTFGHGPKNCVGMKLVYEMTRLIMFSLCKEVRFEGRKDTKVKFVPGRLFVPQFDPIIVDIVPRHI